jgi:hypothetical protein
LYLGLQESVFIFALKHQLFRDMVNGQSGSQNDHFCLSSCVAWSYPALSESTGVMHSAEATSISWLKAYLQGVCVNVCLMIWINMHHSCTHAQLSLLYLYNLITHSFIITSLS